MGENKSVDANIPETVNAGNIDEDANDNVDYQNNNQVIDNSEDFSSEEMSSENEKDDDLEDFDDEDFEQIMMITEGTSITGSITTDCSLDVFGTVNGDIFCDGKLSISGKVIGNSHAAEVMINAHRVEGNIECNGVVKIGQGSVIIGDISAGAAVIAGAVKG